MILEQNQGRNSRNIPARPWNANAVSLKKRREFLGKRNNYFLHKALGRCN